METNNFDDGKIPSSFYYKDNEINYIDKLVELGWRYSNWDDGSGSLTNPEGEKILGWDLTTNERWDNGEWSPIYKKWDLKEEVDKIIEQYHPSVKNKLSLKEYNNLRQDDVNNLKIISQEEFNFVVDLLYKDIKPDYVKIPNVIRLPGLPKKLADELNIKNNNFYIKSELSHTRPHRKSDYGQNLRIEEYKGLLENIEKSEIAYIDTNEKHKNFFIVGIDEVNKEKCNKVVFNKDKLGNYIVTISKIDLGDLNSPYYKKVGAGVAPAIWRSYHEKTPQLTRFVPSTTLSETSDIKKVNQNESVVNKKIIEAERIIKKQNTLLHGQGTVEINGIKREFKHGLMEAFPKAVSLLDQSQSENKRLKEENQKLRNQLKQNDISLNTEKEIGD